MLALSRTIQRHVDVASLGRDTLGVTRFDQPRTDVVRSSVSTPILFPGGFLGFGEPLDDAIRNRMIFLGGKVAGVDCPACEFSSREFELDAHTLSSVTCPDCGATILSENQKSQLRQTGKL